MMLRHNIKETILLIAAPITQENQHNIALKLANF